MKKINLILLIYLSIFIIHRVEAMEVTNINKATFYYSNFENLIVFSDYLDNYVVKYFDTVSKTITSTQIIGNWPSTNGDIIAFTTSESQTNQDLNNDGDKGDYIIQYYKISDRTIYNTGINGDHIKVNKNRLFFRSYATYDFKYLDINTNLIYNIDVKASYYNYDVDGDYFVYISEFLVMYYNLNSKENFWTGGRADQVAISNNFIVLSDTHVIKYYDILNKKLLIPEIEANTLCGISANKEKCLIGRAPDIFKNIIVFYTAEWTVNQDLNNDGNLFYDYVIRYYDIDSKTVINTEIEGQDPIIYGHIVSFVTDENNLGQDLNNDGKLNSLVLRYIELQPQQFWSQLKNSSNGLNLRLTPGVQNKSVDDIIKTLPNDWAIKVASATDESGNNIDLDGYHWYKVEDATDNAIGWMAAKSLNNNIVYLDYDANAQTSLEQKAAVQLDTSDKRKPIILQAVDNFYSTSTINSLYNPTSGLDGNNNFQKFIQGANFLKEFVLAIVAQETGPSFNNEICSGALDGGIGIMQITSSGFKGLGSGLYNKPKLNDCNKNTTGWIGNLSKYYSNAIQGVYANIKDGFRVLQEKYRTQCYEETSGGLYFTCNDIRRILTIWGYNGFGDETGTYLNKIAAKLNTLSSYFSNVIYIDTDQFIQKLRQADRQKILALLKSPGEIQIEDKNGNITGITGNTIQENIPNSLYEKDYKGIAIFFPKNPYIYRVIGTASGTYGLNVDYFNDDIKQYFRATDIPIISDEIHEYLIDWDALLNSEVGITLQIDQNGDKIIDKIFIAGDTFNQTDIFLQNNTIIDFEPDTLNLESNGIATVYIELPIGYNVNNISASSIRLNKVVYILSRPIEIGDYDKDGIPDLMVKFEREKIKSVVAAGEKIPITIIGKVFYNGNYYYFKGQDVIKVINNKAETTPPGLTVPRWALVQRIFNDLGEKVVAVFYKILQ